MFNLVLAFNQNTNYSIDIIYNQIILKVTAALKHEQLRRGYVRKEIELILRLKEDAISNNISNMKFFKDIFFRSCGFNETNYTR